MKQTFVLVVVEIVEKYVGPSEQKHTYVKDALFSSYLPLHCVRTRVNDTSGTHSRLPTQAQEMAGGGDLVTINCHFCRPPDYSRDPGGDIAVWVTRI